MEARAWHIASLSHCKFLQGGDTISGKPHWLEVNTLWGEKVVRLEIWWVEERKSSGGNAKATKYSKQETYRIWVGFCLSGGLCTLLPTGFWFYVWDRKNWWSCETKQLDRSKSASCCLLRWGIIYRRSSKVLGDIFVSLIVVEENAQVLIQSKTL